MATEIMNGEVPVQNGDIDSTELEVDEMEEVEMTGDVDPINGLEDPAKPIRLIRKAKRVHRTNSGGDATSSNGNAGNAVEKIPLLKNSRKSRDGRGRGEPKKGTFMQEFRSALFKFIVLCSHKSSGIITKAGTPSVQFMNCQC